MNNNKYSQIPFANVASGIEHGPHPDIPGDMLDQYISKFATHSYGDTRTLEQFIEDTHSEYQYDQHSQAVAAAAEAGRITADHEIYMLEIKLRPWFIGRRNPSQPE